MQVCLFCILMEESSGAMYSRFDKTLSTSDLVHLSKSLSCSSLCDVMFDDKHCTRTKEVERKPVEPGNNSDSEGQLPVHS